MITVSRASAAVLSALAAALLVGPAGAQTAPPEVLAYADAVFYNGKVLVADDRFTIAEALAVRDGKVLAVGATSRILAMAGPTTQKIDLAGRTATPGFIDTHFHLNTYAFYDNPEIFPVIAVRDLGEKRNKDGLLDVLRRMAPQLQQETPRGQWIVVTDSLDGKHGLIEELMTEVTASELDAIFPDHPVAIGGGRQDAADRFNVNTAGLEIFKQQASPSALKGMVTDPRTGQPTGALKGLSSTWLDYAVLPFPDIEKTAELLQAGMLKYNAQGLTTICTKTPPYQLSALRELWLQGRMTMRWRANIETFLTPDPEQMYKLVGNISDLGDSMLRIRGAYVPGTDGHFPWVWKPAQQLLPGAPPDVGITGSSRTNKWDNQAYAWQYEYLGTKYGWNMTGAHNKGDKGADVMLSAIEAGKKDQLVPNSQQTFGVDHALVLTETTPAGSQWERMKKVNMIPSLGMPFMFDPPNSGKEEGTGKGVAYASMSALEQLIYAFGKDRVHGMLPAKSLIKAGLKPAAESDRGILPQCCPMWNLEKFITRIDDRVPGVVWGTGEKVTREEALLMYTNWAAYYTGDEKSLGTLEPGKIADVVVIDGDYLTVPEERISDLPVVLTMVGGRVVFRHEGF
jgi:predicted amidohydrolase YtcJ